MTAHALLPIELPASRRGEWVFGARLEGEPQRSAKKPGFRGGRITVVPDAKWEVWRDWATLQLQGLWRGRAPVHYPVVAQVVAVFSRPQKPRKTYTAAGVSYPYPWPWTPERVPYIGVPDADQLQKAGLDVLKRAGVLVDDWLVEPIGTPRYYAAVGEEAHVELRLWRNDMATKTKDPGATSPEVTKADQVHADLERLIADTTTVKPVGDVLRHFRFRELANLEQRVMAMRCAELAIVTGMLPPGAEVVVALRELLRYRDQVLRAVLS